MFSIVLSPKVFLKVHLRFEFSIHEVSQESYNFKKIFISIDILTYKNEKSQNKNLSYEYFSTRIY